MSHCKNSLAGHGSECGESHEGTSASVRRASKARSSSMSSSGTLCGPASLHVIDQLGYTIRGDVETVRLKPHSQDRDILCSGTRGPTRHRAQKNTVAFPVLGIDSDRKRSRLHSGRRSLKVLFAPLGGFELPSSDTHRRSCQPFVLVTPCLQSPSSDPACTGASHPETSANQPHAQDGLQVVICLAELLTDTTRSQQQLRLVPLRLCTAPSVQP